MSNLRIIEQFPHCIPLRNVTHGRKGMMQPHLIRYKAKSKAMKCPNLGQKYEERAGIIMSPSVHVLCIQQAYPLLYQNCYSS